jgi:hydrogenase nickel incorporation protein HypB
MFSIVDVLLINKMDVLEHFDFNLEACIERVKKINPDIKIIPISARTGDGIEVFSDWLRTEVKKWKEL